MTTNGARTDPAAPPAIAKRSNLSVRELEASLPSPELVAAQAANLLEASVAAIDTAAVRDMMAKFLDQAKGGDVKSGKLILDHITAHSKRPPAPAPPPLRITQSEPEPPRAVAVAGPGADAQRKLVAYLLLAHQPMSVAAVGANTGLSGDVLEAVLNHEWFDRKTGQVRLTTAGRNAVG